MACQGMFVFLFYLTLLYLPFINGERLPLLYERDVYHTLFGDIGSMQDLFLKESDEPQTSRRDSGTARPGPGPARPEPVPTDDEDTNVDDLDLELPDLFGFNVTDHAFDLMDYLIINEKYSNFTKEYKDGKLKNPMKKPNRTENELKNKTRRSWDDPDDYWHGESIEAYKKNQLIMILAQFALHCRYEVGKALLQRDLVRNDKRYKLGYLFNRMRRLKTELLKQTGAAHRAFWNYAEADVDAMMRNYERVVHFDVDMRDTANLIKTIYSKVEPYDFFVVKARNGQDAEKIFNMLKTPNA